METTVESIISCDSKMCVDCICNFRCLSIEECAKCKLRCNKDSKYDVSYRLQYYASMEKSTEDMDDKFFYRRLYFNLTKSIRNKKMIDLMALNLDLLLYGDNFEYVDKYLNFKKDVKNAIYAVY